MSRETFSLERGPRGRGGGCREECRTTEQACLVLLDCLSCPPVCVGVMDTTAELGSSPCSHTPGCCPWSCGPEGRLMPAGQEFQDSVTHDCFLAPAVGSGQRTKQMRCRPYEGSMVLGRRDGQWASKQTWSSHSVVKR